MRSFSNIIPNFAANLHLLVDSIHFLSANPNFPFFSLSFRKIFVILRRRLLALRGKAGGHLYEKDVFERLSLWFVNLASSNLYNRQMTTKTSAWSVSIYLTII